MASCNLQPSGGGYDDNIFLDPPKENSGFHCPICMLVLNEPHLLSCCGKHVCQVCIQRVKYIGNQCPCCREEQYITVLNKEKKGKIQSLRTYCTNKRNGCDWTGELGDAKRHLETKCDYAEEDCPFGCGQKLTRHALQIHKTRTCTKRPIEIQLKYLTEEMTERLTTLETKYEERVSILEHKLKEQETRMVEREEVFVNELKQMNVKHQEEFEETKRRLIQVIEDRLVESQRKNEHIKVLEEANTAITSKVDCINRQLKKFNDIVPFIPVAKEELECVKASTSFMEIKRDLEMNGMCIEIEEDGVSIQTVHDIKIKETKEEMNQLVSSIQREVVSVSADSRPLLHHMFQTKEGQAIVTRLEKKYSIKFIVDKIKNDDANVGVLGKDKDSAILELFDFLKNEPVSKSLYLNPNVSLQSHFIKVEAFAQSRSVRIVKSFVSFSLMGGKYDVELVEDYMKTNGLIFFN